MKSIFFIFVLFSLNISATNAENELQKTIFKFWDARNNQDFEKIFFYESKIGALTGSSSDNHFYEDPPPDFESVVNYYSTVKSDLMPSFIKIYKLSENVYLSLYYLTGRYEYSNGKINDNYKSRASNIWLYEDEGFKLYYKNFNKLKDDLVPEEIGPYPVK